MLGIESYFDIRFAYAALNAAFLLVWVAIFVTKPQLRFPLVTISIISSVFGFLEPIVAQDYFDPSRYYLFPLSEKLGVEDLLYSFLSGGVGVTIYDFFTNRGYVKHHPERFVTFGTLLALGFAAYLVGTLVFSFHSIIWGVILLIALGIAHVVIRSDLLKDALWSGALFTLLLFFIYYLFLIPVYPEVMEVYLNSKFSILGIPYEELIFAFAWGFYIGTTYKFARGLTAMRTSEKVA